MTVCGVAHVMAAWNTTDVCTVEPVDQYLRSFQWNKVKYRADKSIADLIDALQKVFLTAKSRAVYATSDDQMHRKLQA